MPRKNTPNSFNDPAIRQKAINTRLANVHGKRGRHAFEDVDIPGMWDDATENSKGQRIAPREKEARLALAREKLADALDEVFSTVSEILTTPSKEDGPRVTLLCKILDKLLPDLRAGVGDVKTRSTQIVMGAPLKRLVAAGIPFAAQVTETTESSEESHGHH